MSFAGFLVGSAISALTGRKASRDAQRARESAEQQQRAQIEQDYARQKEFAQNSIQWRVEDAKKAGLHPLYTLQGGGSSYSPSPFQAFGYDPGPAISLGGTLSRFGQGVADYFSDNARRSSELYGPPDSAAGDPVAQAYAVPGYADYLRSQSDVNWQREADRVLPPLVASPQVQPPYGMVSAADRPTMAFWSVPGIGRVIAPDAGNFSEALEGVDSVTGQALILYLNSQLGDRALDWIRSRMPTLDDAKRYTINGLIELGRGIAESASKVNKFSLGR